MGLRFRRRFRIFPGFWLNLSKRLSAGGHGLTVNTGKGGHQETISAIGTGVSYRTRRRKFGNPGGPSNTPRRPVTAAHVLTIIAIAIIILWMPTHAH
jgi:uncharacterized protein DUF4236